MQWCWFWSGKLLQSLALPLRVGIFLALFLLRVLVTHIS
jgi:hypothetical protein